MCAGTITEGPERRGEVMSDFDRFVGVWELEGIEDFLEGKRGPPAGFERSSGLLFYLPTGEMSVNFAGSSRPPVLREVAPTEAEFAFAVSAYGGYAGRGEL